MNGNPIRNETWGYSTTEDPSRRSLGVGGTLAASNIEKATIGAKKTSVASSLKANKLQQNQWFASHVNDRDTRSLTYAYNDRLRSVIPAGYSKYSSVILASGIDIRRVFPIV